MKTHFVTTSALLTVLLAGCSGGNGTSTSSTTASLSTPSSVISVQPAKYAITPFAVTTGSLEPDDVVQVGNYVYVVVQDNNIGPTGTLNPGVTAAQSLLNIYDLSGNLQKSVNVPGHPDGMVDVDSNTLWISTNEDGNTMIMVYNIASGATQTYASDVVTLPHGGGLDDLKVINGVVYASASAPTTTFLAPPPTATTYSTDAAGATAEYGLNSGPAAYSIALDSSAMTFHATPVLMSNTTVNSLPSNTPITLNMTDADSTAIDPNGNFVITSQQDSELVFVSNIGMPSQTVSVLNVTLFGNPWPLDDTRWVPAAGAASMLLTDAPGHIIYVISANGGFAPNTAYSAGQGTVLETDTTTGVMTPIFTGLKNPHGLIFLNQ